MTARNFGTAIVLASVLAIGCVKKNISSFQSSVVPEGELVLEDSRAKSSNDFVEFYERGYKYSFKQKTAASDADVEFRQVICEGVYLGCLNFDTLRDNSLRVSASGKIDSNKPHYQTFVPELQKMNFKNIAVFHSALFWARTAANGLQQFTRAKGELFVSTPLVLPEKMQNALLNAPLSWRHLSKGKSEGLIVLNWKGEALTCRFDVPTGICRNDDREGGKFRDFMLFKSLFGVAFRFDGLELLLDQDDSGRQSIRFTPQLPDLVDWQVPIDGGSPPYGKIHLNTLSFSEAEGYKQKKYQVKMNAPAEVTKLPPLALAPSVKPLIRYGPEFEFDFHKQPLLSWQQSVLDKCKTLRDVVCASSNSSSTTDPWDPYIVKVTPQSGNSFNIDAIEDDVDVEIRMSPLTREEVIANQEIIQKLVFGIDGLAPHRCGGSHLNTSVELDTSQNEKLAYERVVARFYSNPEYFKGLMRGVSNYTINEKFYLPPYYGWDNFIRLIAKAKFVPLRVENNTNGNYSRIEIRASRVVTSVADWIERISFVQDSLWGPALAQETETFDTTRLRRNLAERGLKSNYSQAELESRFSDLKFSQIKFPLMHKAMTDDKCSFEEE